MSCDEYYRLLEEKQKQIDWSNLKSVKEYNEYARHLRHLMEQESEG